jgi:hypothetical protein
MKTKIERTSNIIYMLLFPARLALIIPPPRKAAGVALTHSSFSSLVHRAAMSSMFCFTAALISFKSPSHYESNETCE